MGILVDRLALRNETKLLTLNNIIPDCWIYVQDTGIKMGRIQVLNSWVPYLVEKPEDTVWLGVEFFCEEGDDFWNLSEQECGELSVRKLKWIDVLDEDSKVLD